MRLAPALMLLLWAGAACAQEVATVTEELPPDYPPKMGEISGTLGKKAVAWEFFDFSVGAFDASAWADEDYDSKQVRLHLGGYAPGQPENKSFRLQASGNFGTVFQAGSAEAPLVEVLRGKDSEGPKLTSAGQRAEIVVESIGPQPEDSYSRRVTGRIEARLCPQAWLFKTCQDISLRFDTGVQMGSVVKVKE